ncbi:MAG TPA: PQQ-binding-like beta-propeller repeat protein [Blastocatellia bacterium]|nr:PQQ-binding-like beta-propeller repeat protein [Blastocatellia bacterium]
MKRVVQCLAVLFFVLSCVLSFARSKGPAKDWPVYGGDDENRHYSPLKQINRDNVSKLKVAWTFDTGDAFPGSEMQCNPLVIAGVLYATTPRLRVIALDAATGKLLWSFDPNGGRKVLSKVRSRGLASWSDGKERRLFFTSGQYLYALDAATGTPVASFGDAGRIDLRENLGRDPRLQSVSMTSPGIVYKDLLIVGSLVSETLPASPGDIRAYDVRTGKLRWSFHTIPHPGELGYETWPKDAWKYIGGVNNWTGMSLDLRRGIIFVPTGSASFDFYGANRLGNDLFANTLLALRADTGERIWHYQTVRHDLWDRDLPAPPTLLTVKRDGANIDAVAQITKSGYVFLFDRESGKLLFPIEERKVSTDTVDGERAAVSQPLPVKPPPFARQIFTKDTTTDRTPEAHSSVVARLGKLRSFGQFVPPSREGTVVFPGFDGGGEWGGGAWDPETGLFYVNANEMAWVLRLVESPTRADTGKTLYERNCAGCHRADLRGSPPEFPALTDVGKRYTEPELFALLSNGAGRMPAFHLPYESAHAIADYVCYGKDRRVVVSPDPGPFPIEQKYMIDGYNRFLDPDGYPAVKPPWGTLTAMDLNKGEIVWSIPLGEYPELAAKGLKNTGSENYGGPVVTAGGLLFIGATSFDKKFRAFDKISGRLLWETELPAAGNATPAIYEVNGREYIVIAAGGGKGRPQDSGGTYVAFALPEP